MKVESLNEVYDWMVARRQAIHQQYLTNAKLKTTDPVRYNRYRQELRDINKRLRIIRQCIPANPLLLGKADDTYTVTTVEPVNHTRNYVNEL